MSEKHSNVWPQDAMLGEVPPWVIAQCGRLILNIQVRSTNFDVFFGNCSRKVFHEGLQRSLNHPFPTPTVSLKQTPAVATSINKYSVERLLCAAA